MRRFGIPFAVLILALIPGLLPMMARADAPSAQPGFARVSGPSPFLADCNGPAFPIVAAYVNAEVEPYVAINPHDPKNLIAVYQEDRYPNDGANGVLAAVSFDGGQHWNVPAFKDQPPFSRCAGGDRAHGEDFEKASDPWVAFGSDGIAYFAAVAFNVSNPGQAEFVATSADGGRSWNRPVAVIRSEDPGISNERPAVTADPVHPGVAYLVWDRHRSTPAAKARGWVYFSRTADGGKTWSRARAIYATPGGMETSANQIVVLPNGDLVNVFNELKLSGDSRHPRHGRIAAIRSTDGGLTWSRPVSVARSFVAGVTDPNSGQPIRVGDSFTEIATDPRSGTNTLYAVWGDARFTQNRNQQIALARSTDGGRTWSTPAAIAPDAGTQEFVPAVAVDGDGDVAVTYYSFAAGKSGSQALMTSYSITFSKDGGRSWTQPEALTAHPFDLRTAPFNSGFFLGEYQGLAAAAHSFVVAATLTNGRSLDNRTDIYLRVVTPRVGN